MKVARNVVVLVGLALVLTSCGPAQPEPEPTGPRPTPTEVAEPPEPDEPTIGPVSAFLLSVSALGEESEDEARRRLERSEQIITACMVEQGFEYTPQDYSAPLPWMQDGEVPPAGDPIEAAAEYGYSIATWDLAPAPDENARVDPNADYVAGMSDAERRAYDLALYGPGQGEAYAVGEEPYDWTKYGCYGVSDHELGIDVREYFDDTPYRPLRREIEGMWASVDDDPRVLEAERQWASCMADAGHPGLNRVRDAAEGIRAADERIWQEAYDGVGLDLSTEDYLTSPEYLTAQQTITERRRELAVVEVETAVADATCQEEVGYRVVVGRTGQEIEQAFYDAHLADFESWLAALEEFHAGQ
jgi:hypothetical protein